MARIIVMIDKSQNGESQLHILVEPNFESFVVGVRRPTTVEDREGADVHSCCTAVGQVSPSNPSVRRWIGEPPQQQR